MHKFCLTIVLMLTMICHGSNAQEINQFTYSHLVEHEEWVLLDDQVLSREAQHLFCKHKLFQGS